MGDTALDLEAIEARCEALDERMSDMSELAWTLEGPNHYGLFSVYDSDGNAVSHGIRERQDFIAHARRDVPALLAAIKQLCHELHDERVRRDEWEKMYNQAIAGTEVERLQEALKFHEELYVFSENDMGMMKAQRDGARDACASYREKVKQLQAELAQAQDELAVIGKLAQAKQLHLHVCAYCGYQYPLGSKLTEHIESCPEHPLAKVKTELAQLQTEHEIWDVTEGDKLSPCEAEGLKRQLAKAQMQSAAPKKAVEWLWGFYDGNTLVAKPGYEDDIREAWKELLIAVDSITGDALLERLATAEHRAEVLEQERDEWRGAWESITAALLNTREQLTRIERRAEGLSALVTPELAALLERLANDAEYVSTVDEPYRCMTMHDAVEARGLAARIREALEETE